MKVPNWVPAAAAAGAVVVYLLERSFTKGDAGEKGYTPPMGFVPRGCGGRPGDCPPEGAPGGYHYWTGHDLEVVAYARSLLAEPIGSWHQVVLGGTSYMMHLECHFHPCDGIVGPRGWHKGTTVYAEDAA